MSRRPSGPISKGDYFTRPDKQAYTPKDPLIVDPLFQKSQSKTAKKMARWILLAITLIILVIVIIYIAGN